MGDQQQTPDARPAPADPARVIAVAHDWIGTPYRHQASTSGAGYDCLGLARGVWRALQGTEPFALPPYTRDWGEAGAREVLEPRAAQVNLKLQRVAIIRRLPLSCV